MDKKERKKKIKEQIAKIVLQRESLRLEGSILSRELSFINGNYDKSWEEEYGM